MVPSTLSPVGSRFLVTRRRRPALASLRDESADQAEDGAFAAAGRTHQHEELPILNM
jgi:hypothetical protein